MKRGFPVAILSSLFLSTTAIFIRHLTQTYQLPALILAFWRDIFVVLTILPILLVVKPTLVKLHRRHFLYIFIYGFVLAAFNAFWSLSVAINGAAVATVLVYCSAAFTAILGFFLLNEKLNSIKILAILLSLTGCIFVAGAYDIKVWQSNLLGILVGVLAGLAYAIYSLMGRSASQRGIKPWTILLYTFAIASIFLFFLNHIPFHSLFGTLKTTADFFWLAENSQGWFLLFVLAAIPTVLGFGLYNVSLQFLPSSVANLILTSEPVFTSLIAYFLLGERLTNPQIAGGLLVLSGVILLRIFER